MKSQLGLSSFLAAAYMYCLHPCTAYMYWQHELVFRACL